MKAKVQTLDPDKLTPLEKQNLDRRGFLSLELIPKRQYFITLFSHIVFLLISILIFFSLVALMIEFIS